MIEGEGVCRLHKLEAMKRFAFHTEEEIIAKRQNVVRKFTAKAHKASANLLRAYLTEKNMESNFESFSAVKMTEPLCHLYMDIRTKNGELYKATTMMNNRHVLNKYLKSPHHLNKSMI
jgi:hypothetical protein